MSALLARPIYSAPRGTTYADRCAALVDYYADREDGGVRPRAGYVEVAARLWRGDPVERVLPVLEPLLADPHGDMFWMWPMTLVHFAGKDRLPTETLAQMRDLWRTYTPYRGDTENHWLLYYASLYLMSEAYPDDDGAAWFDGRSSAEHREDALGYLTEWTRRVVTEGQGEFDSPHYLPCFVAPLALLHGFAEARDVRERAARLLDLLLAEFAVGSMGGLHVGGLSRVYPEPALERWRNGSTTLAWLAYGAAPLRPDGVNVVLPRPGYRPHGMALALAVSAYAPPPILRAIATERSATYVHRSRHRSRDRLRASEERSLPVCKTVFMHPDYAAGSIQGGLVQPIQQHTWEVMWREDDPLAGFNVFFALHPYAGEREVRMYFPEEPRVLVEGVARHEKGTYGDADKWTGGSPFEQVAQHEGALVALYDIPEDDRHPHVQAYFSRRLEGVEARASGWITARGGAMWLGVYPLAPYVWHDLDGGDRRLFCPHRRAGFLVQTAALTDFDSASDFADALAALPLETSRSPSPRVAWQTLSGAMLRVAFEEVPSVDGDALDYEAWPRTNGPHLQAEGARFVLAYGGDSQIVDFAGFVPP